MVQLHLNALIVYLLFWLTFRTFQDQSEIIGKWEYWLKKLGQNINFALELKLFERKL